MDDEELSKKNGSKMPRNTLKMRAPARRVESGGKPSGMATSPYTRPYNMDDSFSGSDNTSKGRVEHLDKKHKKKDHRSATCQEVKPLEFDSPIHPNMCSIGEISSNEKDIDNYMLSDKIQLKMSDDCDATSSDVFSTELTGDFSRELCLPLCPSKLSDLNAISPMTAVKVMNGEYNHVIYQFIIIDCRYPYEYEGGHIKDALNFPLESDCAGMFQNETLSTFSEQQNRGKRTVVLLHCEFSQMRGPNMARCLRNADRTANGDSYPALHYPEIYVIEGGYNAFHSRHPTQCCPPEYVSMDHPSYSAELAYFRSKSSKTSKKMSKRRTTVAMSPL